MAARRTDTRPQQVQCPTVALEELYREENGDGVISGYVWAKLAQPHKLYREERVFDMH